MWNINLAIMLTFSIFMGLNLLVLHPFLLAQIDNTEIFPPNNTMTTGTSSNTTGIMKNTSGMIDDAFDALKDSFGSFFGK